ncbi:MAG TPA: hypothetical protein VJN62_03910 [Gemmatimonadales bacterium]|nr:hypothetical protein [Gemmatimonadales bacterium]
MSILNLVLFAMIGSAAPHPGQTLIFAPHTTCPGAPAAAFHWWPGTWDYATPGYDPAVSTVTVSDDGCTFTEVFVDIHQQRQHTTIQYDATAHRWQRVVVDPFRTYRSTGVFAADGSIAFYETPGDRETYRPTDADHVHFIGEKSTDGGKTWRVLFDATYTRRR